MTKSAWTSLSPLVAFKTTQSEANPYQFRVKARKGKNPYEEKRFPTLALGEEWAQGVAKSVKDSTYRRGCTKDSKHLC